MVVVHHLENSRSQRVLWLLEELGVPYEVKRYERNKTTMLAPPELKAVHPLGKSPVITDGGVVIAESGNIIEYLVETYGQGRMVPASGTPERLRYRYWLHYAEGSAMPPLLMSLVFSKLKQAPMPFFVKPVARGIADKAMSSFVGPQVKLHLDYMEGELGKSSWFSGKDFSAADIQMSFPVESAASRAGDVGDVSRLTEFVKRIKDRPAFQKAIERGGPYELG